MRNPEREQLPVPAPTNASSSSAADGKEPWQEPKLSFVEPKLTKHGSLEEVTGEGFFGGFTPA